jgi:hypothetical protein
LSTVAYHAQQIAQRISGRTDPWEYKDHSAANWHDLDQMVRLLGGDVSKLDNLNVTQAISYVTLLALARGAL